MVAGWNKGKHWSNEVKAKISQTMRRNHRMHSWTAEELTEWGRRLNDKRKLKTLQKDNS